MVEMISCLFLDLGLCLELYWLRLRFGWIGIGEFLWVL